MIDDIFDHTHWKHIGPGSYCSVVAVFNEFAGLELSITVWIMVRIWVGL